MGNEPGQGRRRSPFAKLLESIAGPTTGDGFTGGQKPRISETNLPRAGRGSRLRRPGWLPGRHSKN